MIDDAIGRWERIPREALESAGVYALISWSTPPSNKYPEAVSSIFLGREGGLFMLDSFGDRAELAHAHLVLISNSFSPSGGPLFLVFG